MLAYSPEKADLIVDLVQSFNDTRQRTPDDELMQVRLVEMAPDQMVEAARGFCYGFLSGVNHYHSAVNAGKRAQPLYCLPDPKPTRADAARMYVAWSRANTQYLKEAPVDNVVRFAVATWPCKTAKR